MKIKLDYLRTNRSRHGKVRYYVHAPRISPHPRIRIHAKPGTRAFLDEYNAAHATVMAARLVPESDALITGPKPNTFGWMASDYFANDDDFRHLAKNSQRARRNCIEECLREPLEPGGKLVMRDLPFVKIGVVHMQMLVDRKRDEPGAANNRRKHISTLCAYGARKGMIRFNPMREVKSRPEGEGFHTWLPEEILKYQAFWPLGTKERLAQEMLYYLGARGQDVRLFGDKDLIGGAMFYVPQKTEHVRKSRVRKPVADEVNRAIAACRKSGALGEVHFLETHHGEAYTQKGFGNWFNESCALAGLPHCTAHGLKKSAATMAAYKGIPERTMMAMFDWSSIRMVEKYTRAAAQWRLAEEGMAALAKLSPVALVTDLGAARKHA